MRAHHVTAVIAVLIIGLGAKQFVFPPKHADANTFTTTSMNLLQMQSNKDMRTLPQQKMNDEEFIFTDKN